MTSKPRTGRSVGETPVVDVAGLILAAGLSSRFGSPKQLAPVGGDATMLDEIARVARRAALEPVVAVLPPGVAAPSGAVRVGNDRPHDGLSRSLRIGIAALPGEVRAAVVLLGDQPTIGPQRLAELLRARGARPVVATMDPQGVLAPPVLLERAAFPLVGELSGDAGLRHLLRERGELVEPVVVASHLPDVDTPADLATKVERCPGCRGLYARATDAGPHPYIGAASGCWAAYGELLAREFADPAFAAVHRHSADAYAAQHPDTNGRRQRQSVALHLVALCHWLEHGLDAGRLTPITRRLAREEHDWPWLVAPAEYAMDVRDVLAAAHGEAHARLVRAWAESVWEAWSAHHETVRRWAAAALAGG